MTAIIEKLAVFSTMDFFWSALIVGTLVALCASLLGVTLVLRRFSFIGDGLSHVAFGALTVAMVSGITNEMIIIMPSTIAAAVVLLKTGRRRKIMGDASLAMLSVGALGLGYLIVSKFGARANVSQDVCTSLFGSDKILTLSAAEVWTCAIAALAVLCIFVFFYNKIFAVTFDSDFASATGTQANVYSLIIAVVTAVVIVLAMYLVGSLLISALVVFPALSAMRVFKSFKSVVICSGVVAVCSSVTGILAHILLDTPIGSTVVVTQLLFFIVFSLVGAIRTRRVPKTA